MKNNQNLKITTYFLISLLIFICFTLFIIYRFDSNTALAQLSSKQIKISQGNIKFISEAKSFQIIDHQILEKETMLFLKNDYNKSINSFYITIGSKEEYDVYDVELQYSEVKNKIFPDEIFKFPVDLNNKIFSGGVQIKAVLFTDGTGDGDLNIIQNMREQRNGEKDQLKKGLQLLKTVELSSDSYLSDLETIKGKIDSLLTKDKTRSQEYNAGLSFGRDRLLHYLKQIENKADNSSLNNAQEDIKKLQLRIEDIIQSL